MALPFNGTKKGWIACSATAVYTPNTCNIYTIYKQTTPNLLDKPPNHRQNTLSKAATTLYNAMWYDQVVTKLSVTGYTHALASL
jgi:hypothetical protein